MSSMKKTKEGINLKKLLRLKNTGSIFVIAGLLMILVIASYTYILQSSYTKTALETEITRDTASADAVHKLVDGRICKEDFDQIKDQSDEKKQLYKDISSYFNEIRTLNSTRYIYTAKKNEEGKLVYVVDGLDPDADDVRHPGDYIEEEMVPYIDRAISGENVYSHNIIDTTWGPIFTACYPVSANHDGTGEIIGAFCIEMDMQSAYGMVEKTNHISIICGLVAGAVLLLICLYTYYVYQKSKAEEQKQKQLLMTAAEEADAANKAKSAFLLSISHDIRTPMNAIIGFTNIALHQNTVSDIQESLNSGMNDHISKPINMEELIDTITKYIKHDQENKEVNSDEKFALVLSDAKAQVSYDYDTGCITTFLISTQHQEDTSVMDIRPLVEAVMETAGKIKNDNMSDQDFYKLIREQSASGQRKKLLTIF